MALIFVFARGWREKMKEKEREGRGRELIN